MSSANSAKLRMAVLASGEGQTLQALLDASESGALHGEVVLLLSNNADSGAMLRAQQQGIATLHLSSKTHPDADALDAAVTEALLQAQPDVVVMTGYMKRLGLRALDAFKERIINTHPSLLPKFGGQGMYDRHVHSAVLAAGERETGATVHFVEGDYDSGRHIAHVNVPVLSDDSVDSLAQRVKTAERLLLVHVLQQRALLGHFIRT
ncbi:MAG TPA: phosphoribosylglycinamide formyltransferase [Rhodocyclaceae bacterium]|nr:phosphoribosylglycinamide formyltransferase [Rhodocyclaceae bacterium]